MTIFEQQSVPPISGVPLPLGEALPVPQSGQAEQIITVTTPQDRQAHEVQIFTSRDKELGSAVTTLAQELHTRVYLERGIIRPDELNALGMYVDHYSRRSAHYFVKNGSKVSAARAVYTDKKQGGIMSLPTLARFEVDADKLAQVAGVDSVAQIKPSQAIEISGLVSQKKEGAADNDFGATVALYSRMIRDSLEQGHTLWVANVEPVFQRYLGGIVGSDNVVSLGPAKDYMGPATRPIALNPQSVVRTALQAEGGLDEVRKAYLKEVLAGVSDKNIPADIRALLRENGIPTKEYPAAKRVATDPRAIGYAVIMGYSSARALPAAGVDEFNGSTALLWGIDVATAVPYTWGVINAFAGKSAARKVTGALVGAGSFVAPYAYFAAEGNDYPWYVNTAVAGFIGVAVAKETLTRTLRSRRNRSLREALSHSDLQAPARMAGRVSIHASTERVDHDS